jgi:hypothetical protein
MNVLQCNGLFMSLAVCTCCPFPTWCVSYAVGTLTCYRIKIYKLHTPSSSTHITSNILHNLGTQHHHYHQRLSPNRQVAIAHHVSWSNIILFLNNTIIRSSTMAAAAYASSRDFTCRVPTDLFLWHPRS